MPKFAIISPTHVEGKKKEAWENFKNGGYIALGSTVNEDLSGIMEGKQEKIIEVLERAYEQKYRNKTKEENKKRAKKMYAVYKNFFSLDVGDYVAVNNTNDGLFGVGVIISGYYFREHAHDTGVTNPEEFYSHFRDIKWLVTDYKKREGIVARNETGWAPYGIIHPYLEVPEYIRRVLQEYGYNENIIKNIVMENAKQEQLEQVIPTVDETSSTEVIDKAIIEREEREQEKEALRLSLEELKKRAQRAETKPPIDIKSRHYPRDINVSVYVKKRANGKCELCGKDAPFISRDNEPFLECHHIIGRAENGPDTIYNTVALCPNCHRKVHNLGLEEDKKILKDRAV